MFAGSVFRALFFAAVSLFAFDLLFYAEFPRFDRLRYNFSSAYLRRSLAETTGTKPVVFLGDSVLWGYGVSESQAAVTIARAAHPDWKNYAFAGGSCANSLALLELLLHSGVRPRLVVFNVNEKTFNSEDSAYRKLHPAVEELAALLVPPALERHLEPTLETTLDARTDRAISRYWRFYGMRADVRDAVFRDTDAAHATLDLVERFSGAAASIDAMHRPTPDKFEGTYDMSPIEDDNVEMVATRELSLLLRSRKIPSIAVLTPTNHRLLHDYIDVPQYRANLTSVSRTLRKDGVHVLDLDATFPTSEFIDNDHLTVAGNRRLARILERAVGT